MNWSEVYTKTNTPTKEDISHFVDNPLWEKLNDFLTESYEVEPNYSYSGCVGQPGWNVKYKKAGRALCTLYPMDGYFIALVTIGKKELPETEMILPALTEYTRELFKRTEDSPMGRWLMIEVKSEEILEDVMNLIQIRRKIKK